MFDTLGDKLEQVFRRLKGRGKVTERDLDQAMRDIRLALFEADVNVRVVQELVARVRQQALGREILASLTPEQYLIKFVHQELTRAMGESVKLLDLPRSGLPVVMLVGLQGSGKTTTAAKLARLLQQEHHRRPYLVPADVYRPAAAQQLLILAGQIGCPAFTEVEKKDPVRIARDALAAASRAGCDTVIIDTAGRLHIDEGLMEELSRMKRSVNPAATLLVADAMTGQDAVNVAEGFNRALSLDGVILTKLDGDARGGAALSIRSVTGVPIYFAGTGERLECLEPFFPDRIASRVLGKGDVLSLIEKVERAYDREQVQALERKLRRNEFTLEDFRDQVRAIRRLGSMGELLAMIPGMKKLAQGVDGEVAEKELRKVEAIINSMTPKERLNDGIIGGSRRKRIARGSGTSVSDVNRLLKQYQQMKKMMKQFSKLGGRGAGRIPFRGLFS